jgi:FkbM family methyltransferase
MTPTQWIHAKYRALRTLITIVAQVDNWREVWLCFHGRGNTDNLPTLHFRRGLARQGLAIRHRPADSMFYQFGEVFRDKLYRQFVKEPRHGVMVDIGANIGVVSLDWASRLPHVCIHAYEPHPATFAVLSENVAANHLELRMKILQQAVGRQAGTLTLRSMAEGSMLTTACENSSNETSTASARVGSFCPEAGQWWGTIADEFTVSTVSLDEVIERCAADGTVHLVKIDTEGAEADILEGARPETLAAIEQFVLEYHDVFCPDALARCERVLTDAGFKYVVRPLAPGLGMLYARNPAFA